MNGADNLTQKNYNPVLETTSTKTFEIENPFSRYKTYMSNLTLLTNANFAVHGSITISIADIPVIKESDAELVKESSTVLFPTNRIILAPREKIIITIKSNDAESVSAAVLFTLATEPLPADYFVEAQNQAEIKALFSNVGGNSVLLPDEYREYTTEYADINMQGYTDAYITLKLTEAAARGNLNLGIFADPNAWFENHFQVVIESFRGEAENNSDRIYFEAVYGRNGNNTRISEITNARIIIGKAGLPNFKSACTVTVSYNDLNRSMVIKMINDDPIPENMRDAVKVDFVFGLDDTNASGNIIQTYETIATDNPETGRASLELEVNTGAETWEEIAADQTNELIVSASSKNKTISIGLISGVILPTGKNILRLALTTTGRARTQTTAIRV